MGLLASVIRINVRQLKFWMRQVIVRTVRPISGEMQTKLHASMTCHHVPLLKFFQVMASALIVLLILELIQTKQFALMIKTRAQQLKS